MERVLKTAAEKWLVVSKICNTFHKNFSCNET